MRSTFLRQTATAFCVMAFAGSAVAADYAGAIDQAPAALPPAGVACRADTIPWPEVWLGHFSGGRSTYDPAIGRVGLDWQDIKLCFPTRRSCREWVRDLRRVYHRPESFDTCLLLR